MTETQRDINMRTVGKLQAITDMLSKISIPYESKSAIILLDSGRELVNKAMLSLWEEADKL